jgi:nitrite reductase (cytochrome c-552)
VRSPLLNISNACRTCHALTEDELRARAERIQQNTFTLRDHAMDALVALIGDIKAARAGGASDQRLATAREMQRRAQFYLDFVEAENSTGFHAPQEAARILGESMNYARQGQIAVRDPAYRPQVPGEQR